MEHKVNEKQAEITQRFMESQKKEPPKPTEDTATIVDDKNPEKTQDLKSETPPATEIPKDKDTPVVEAIDEDKIFRKKLKEELGYENASDIKNLLASNPTPEQKEAYQKDYERQVVDEFIATNGIDKYNEIQQKIGKDKFELVREEFFDKNADDLKGLTTEEKELEFKAHYNIDEEKFTESQIKRGQKRIENKAESIKAKLIQPIKDAEVCLKSKLEVRNNDTVWQQSVDEFTVKELPSLKTITKLVGKLGEVKMDVPPEIYDNIVSELKDMKKFGQRFQENGQTSKKKIAEFIFKAEMFDKYLDNIAATLDKHIEDVDAAAFTRGTKEASKILPSEPDFSKTGDQPTQTGAENDVWKAANDKNRLGRSRS